MTVVVVTVTGKYTQLDADTDAVPLPPTMTDTDAGSTVVTDEVAVEVGDEVMTEPDTTGTVVVVVVVVEVATVVDCAMASAATRPTTARLSILGYIVLASRLTLLLVVLLILLGIG
jgi:hypothetical protein